MTQTGSGLTGREQSGHLTSLVRQILFCQSWSWDEEALAQCVTHLQPLNLCFADRLWLRSIREVADDKKAAMDVSGLCVCSYNSGL
jgi:hypothetical protein